MTLAASYACIETVQDSAWKSRLSVILAWDRRILTTGLRHVYDRDAVRCEAKALENIRFLPDSDRIRMLRVIVVRRMPRRLDPEPRNI